jgi:hypothetical protein
VPAHSFTKLAGSRIQLIANRLAFVLAASLAACVFVKGGTVVPVIVNDSPAAADAYQIRSQAPVGVEGAPGLKLEIHWEGDHATATLKNEGQAAVPVHDIVLFDWQHKLPPNTAFYGEGFQMLSQTAGTIEKPEDLEQYTDRGHYKLPEPAGFRSVYGVAMFSRPDPSRLLVGFSSCRRFVGRIDVSTSRIRAVLDADGVAIDPARPGSSRTSLSPAAPTATSSSRASPTGSNATTRAAPGPARRAAGARGTASGRR